MTPRERVVEAVRDGARTSRDVADRLGISVTAASWKLRQAADVGAIVCTGETSFAHVSGRKTLRTWALAEGRPRCTFFGCDRVRKGQLPWCVGHYTQQRRGRPLTPLVTRRPEPTTYAEPRVVGVVGREVRSQGRTYRVVWNGGSLEGVSPGW